MFNMLYDDHRRNMECQGFSIYCIYSDQSRRIASMHAIILCIHVLVYSICTVHSQGSVYGPTSGATQQQTLDGTYRERPSCHA
jgi:hypothetical protein